MNTTPCQSCTATIPSGNRFCGMCGAPVGGGPAPALMAAPSSPGWGRRYRGPLWVGGIGSVLFVGGAGLVTLILSAVQVEAAPGLLVDIFGPAVQDQVDGTIGEGVVDLGGGGTDKLETLGLLTVAGLFGGALLAALGALMVVIACAWAANRGLGGRRGGTVAIPPPPIPAQYAAPTFAPPNAPTWTQAPPPASPPPSAFPQSPPPSAFPQAPPPSAFPQGPPTGPPAGPQDPPTFVKPPR